jgi:hypothetical protein
MTTAGRRSLPRCSWWRAAAVVVALATGTAPLISWSSPVPESRSELPSRLNDQQFWRLSSSFSEPGGTFHSDNFVSNEGRFQTVIPGLLERVKPGGFYVGVGPEQNFTYIAALRPRMAVIVDIRRGNLHEHLLYKALMEMSQDRAEFLSRLFVRPRPAGLASTASVESLFTALETSVPTEEAYRRNLQDVLAWLTTRHTFPLTAEDRAGIDYVYRTAFFADGPDLNYRLTGRGGRRGLGTPTYAELMAMDDGQGRQRSYLASEINFAYVKDLQSRNLIVPVVGDFAGPSALRSVGQYARQQGTMIDIFYVSNVEQYLQQGGKWAEFCANVATMPLSPTSTFIRTVRGGGGVRGGVMFTSSLAAMQDDVRACAASR